MKLELKHLAPYLHYGLKIEILNYKSDYVGLQYSILEGCYKLVYNDYFTYKGGSIGKSVNEFKPILRPLSDLENYYQEFRDNRPVNLPLKDFDRLFEMATVIMKDIKHAPYWFIQMMLKKHIDINGLIEKGLAIDINTLNKSNV